MNTCIIRNIREEDNEELAKMIRSVFREFNVVRPGTVYDDPTTDDLYSLFTHKGSAFFLLECDNKIVGSAGIYPTKDLPVSCCELVKFYLSPEVRGKGFGKQMMEKCFDAAVKSGYTHMYLESFPEFMTALNLYTNAGFKTLQSPMGNSGHTGCTVWMLKELLPQPKGMDV